MELKLLKGDLVKLKHDDVFKALDSWKFLKKNDIQDLQQSLASTKQTKRSLATEISEFCEAKGNLTLELVFELELICLQMYPSKKRWSAYHLEGKQGPVSSTETSPSKLKSKMMRQIRNYFHKDCCVSLILQYGLLWGHLYLPARGPKRGFQSTRCLYFIHYPQSPVILFHGMKTAFVEYVSQCLIVALGYKEMTDLSLTGHHYPSLAELALNKFSEGGYTRYQQAHRLHGPLNEITSKKRKAKELIEHEAIIDLNREAKRQRLEHIDRTFGDNVMPTLEKVEYKVELPYRNKEIFSELKHDGKLFRSKVTFRGASVLEGIRNLAEASYATLPLPKHLTCISTRARNTFLLAQPQNVAMSTQAGSQNQSQQVQSQSQKVQNQSQQVQNQSHQVQNQSRQQSSKSKGMKKLQKKEKILKLNEHAKKKNV